MRPEPREEDEAKAKKDQFGQPRPELGGGKRLEKMDGVNIDM